MEAVKPLSYSKTRNFIDGDVSYLSPYISRGVISTKQVMESVLKRGYNFTDAEKFIQELAWRDYWQQVWIAKGDKINLDLKQEQTGVENYKMSLAILEAKTGINAIDDSIKVFYQTAYLHNHVRMYVAAICCNTAKSHWYIPAKWMYYHLLDADWASNALSWQWVAGSNSHKKYIANQENINRYCYSSQRNTFLDHTYEDLAQIPIPKKLKEFVTPILEVFLPESDEIRLKPHIPTLIYNFYNLDPLWKKDEEVNRILLLEPSIFQKYPVSNKTIQFILELAKNIKGIQIYVGDFQSFTNEHQPSSIHFKEHPLNRHYKGIEETRDWMFDVKGYYPSFFSFWKKCKKQF